MIEFFLFHFFDNSSNNRMDKSLVHYNFLVCSWICSEQTSVRMAKMLLSLLLLFQKIFLIKGIRANTKKYTHIKIIDRATFALVSQSYQCKHCGTPVHRKLWRKGDGLFLRAPKVTEAGANTLQWESDSMDQCKTFLAYGHTGSETSSYLQMYDLVELWMQGTAKLSP